MTGDHDLILLSTLAILIFAGLAILFPTLIRQLTAKGRLSPPPRLAVLIFRLWFGLLALATLGMLLFSPHSLAARPH